MKSFIFLLTLALSMVLTCSARAQAPTAYEEFNVPSIAQAQTLTKYDDFNGPLLDYAKWVSVSNWGNDVGIMEGGMKIAQRKLNFFNRAFGGIGSDTGTQWMQRRLVIKDGSAYNTMETSVQIMTYQITGCSVPGSDSGLAYVRIGGYFFNDGSSTGAADRTGDYFAYINLYRYSDSTDRDGMWRATAKVYRCTDADCTSSLLTLIGEDFFSSQLIKTKSATRLFVQLDKAAKQFYFQIGPVRKGPKAFVSYSADDANGPRSDYGGLKRIEVSNGLANCTAGPAAGWIDAVFDYVAVGP